MVWKTSGLSMACSTARSSDSHTHTSVDSGWHTQKRCCHSTFGSSPRRSLSRTTLMMVAGEIAMNRCLAQHSKVTAITGIQ